MCKGKGTLSLSTIQQYDFKTTHEHEILFDFVLLNCVGFNCYHNLTQRI